MTSKKDTLGAALLPLYFKKVGLGFILLTIVVVALLKGMNISFTPEWTILLPTLVMNSLLAGLLMISLSRDKEEDEMTLQLRWKAMVWAFIMAAGYVIVIPFTNMLFNASPLNTSAQQIVLLMLLGFLIKYTYLKKTR